MRDLKVPDLAVISGFVIDCLLSDTHNFPAEVTDFEVESGSTISDNIRNKPLVVTMECLVTDTPIGAARNFRHGDPANSSDACYEMLQALRNSRDVVFISTSLRTYDNMALEDLSIPRSDDYGDGTLKFTAQFKQVTFKNVDRETRTATPGTGGGGSLLLTPTEDKGTDYVYINHVDGTWYDKAIFAWREDIAFETSAVEGLVINKHFRTWRLYRGRPVDYIDEKTYDNERVSQHTVAALKPRMLKAQGGSPIPIYSRKRGSLVTERFDTRTLASIQRNTTLLRPEQYFIESLQPVR